MLRGLSHPNIVKYYDLIETFKETADDDSIQTDSDSNSTTTTSTASSLASYRSNDDGKIFLVMEWLGDGTNLSKAHLTAEQRKSVLKQLLQALVYLHDNEIAHHDIKPDNIIYCPQSDKLTLIDFGVAERCINDESFCGFGTPAYQPPELVHRQPAEAAISGSKADVWSAGVVAFQLASETFDLPFEGDTVYAVFESIVKSQIPFSAVKDTKLRALLRGLLEKNPKHRLSAREALEHAYFTDRKLSWWTRIKNSLF